MITVKKYSNRRLYDTSVSSYITQEELAERIREGKDVRVVHAKTDEDITQQVLAQIILESRGAARLLPVPLLMRLIRMGDDRLAEFFGQFMSWSLELYLQFKEGAETMGPYNPFSNNMLSGPEAFFRMFLNQSPWEDSAPWEREEPNGAAGGEAFEGENGERPEPTPPLEEPADTEDVEELRAEIDELKSMIRQMAGDEETVDNAD